MTNGWWWVARGLPGQTVFPLGSLSGDSGFFAVGSTNGFDPATGITDAYRALVGDTNTLSRDMDGDGLPDAWEIKVLR